MLILCGKCPASPIDWTDNEQQDWIIDSSMCNVLHKESRQCLGYFIPLHFEIWQNRNCFVFEKKSIPQPDHTIRKAIYVARDFSNSYKSVNIEPK